MAKGGQFERDICKVLSQWWAGRSDVFWRTAGSGARATVRAKKGQKTYGSYGDIYAVDPVGSPFTRLFTIELKKGYNSSTLFDFLDGKKPLFEKWISKLRRTKLEAGSSSWMLIHRRDWRKILVYIPLTMLIRIMRINPSFEAIPRGEFKVRTRKGSEMNIVCMSLDTFLKVKPRAIAALYREDFERS